MNWKFWQKKIEYKFSTKPSIKDKRNFKHKDKAVSVGYVPPKLSLRKDVLNIYQQGSLGTCYAHGAVELLEHRRKKIGLPYHQLSRMFMSYVVRMVEAETKPKEMLLDNGATLLNTAKGMQKYGTCLEELYPYKDNLKYFQQMPYRNDGLAVKDSFNILLNIANLYKIKEYVFVENVDELKQAINSGHAVAIGIDIYPNFMKLGTKTYTGRIGNENFLGGHFLVAVGYDDETRRVEFLNSWGTDFGDKGFGYVDYSFLNAMIDKFDAFYIKEHSEVEVEDYFEEPTVVSYKTKTKVRKSDGRIRSIGKNRRNKIHQGR